MCRLIVFNKKSPCVVFPNAHISAIINSISNEGVLHVQFLRGGTVCVEIWEQSSALRFARQIGEHHTYDRVLIFRDR